MSQSTSSIESIAHVSVGPTYRISQDSPELSDSMSALRRTENPGIECIKKNVSVAIMRIVAIIMKNRFTM